MIIVQEDSIETTIASSATFEDGDDSSTHNNDAQHYFPIHSNSPVLTENVATGLVGYGISRVKRALAGSFDHNTDLRCTRHNNNNNNKVGLFKHSHLALGSLLGEGGFSRVYTIKSFHNNNKKSINNLKANKVVVKFLRRKLMDNPKMFGACIGDLYKESLLLANLSHKNIVGVHGYTDGGIHAYNSGRHDAFFLLLDKLDYTLTDQLTKWQSSKSKLKFKLSGKTSKKLRILHSKVDTILQLGEAINYVHSQGMIHRDIKPENIGFIKDPITGKATLKLFDFDNARVLPKMEEEGEGDGSKEITYQMTRRIGSPRYMSPECHTGKRYNAKTDVYAYGLLVHEILTLKIPYVDLPPDVHVKAVIEDGKRPKIPLSTSKYTGWTKQLGDLVSRCWSADLSKRPTMDQALQQMQVELPQYILHKIPPKKITKFSTMTRNKVTTSSNGNSRITSSLLFANKVVPPTQATISSTAKSITISADDDTSSTSEDDSTSVKSIIINADDDDETTYSYDVSIVRPIEEEATDKSKDDETTTTYYSNNCDSYYDVGIEVMNYCDSSVKSIIVSA